MVSAIAAFGLSLGLLAGCGNPVTGQAERSVMDERAKIDAGLEGHKQMLSEHGVVKDAMFQAYLNQVRQRLAAQSRRASLQWIFNVFESPKINAFALPSGCVYATRSLLAFMASEAVMAGAIGHVGHVGHVGHLTARQSAQRANKSQNASLGVLAPASSARCWSARA